MKDLLLSVFIIYLFFKSTILVRFLVGWFANPGTGIFMFLWLMLNVGNSSILEFLVNWDFTSVLGLCRNAVERHRIVEKVLPLLFICVVTDNKAFRIQDCTFLFRNFPFL